MNDAPATDLDPDDGGAHVKETLESILVAFILAFIFRCFVVEAFVIPTGSMAPTLLGAHSRFLCPDCGYRFDVNYSSPKQSDDEIDIPSRVQSVAETDRVTGEIKQVPVVYDDIHCPNCGLRLPPEPNPAVWYGDRILVLKYMYLLQSPRRWDVVVFKSPSEWQKDYSINFIKRLIGLPGETIMVLDGDIYVKARGAEHFEIARKTPAAQEAMWRIIYDNDFHPDLSQARSTPWRQPWRQAGGEGKWSTMTGNGRVFTFDGAEAGGTLSFDADANRPDNKSVGFSDWLAYDQQHSTQEYDGYRTQPPWKGEYPVSDLKLDLYYQRTAGEGPLKLKLTKLDRAFIAEIHPGEVRLACEVDGKKQWEKTAATPARTANTAATRASAAPMHVEFANVDYRVTVRIDGRDVLQTSDAEYQPDIDKLKEQRREGGARAGGATARPTVSIIAERQTCQVSHVSLWRDVYYTYKLAGNQHYIHWAGPGDGAGTPMVLGDDEYFVMGDNSPMSFDARFWRDRIDLKDEDLHVDAGRVPERFMLGKAFFVYWPAGFRPARGAPGIVPNFAQMRFIR